MRGIYFDLAESRTYSAIMIMQSMHVHDDRSRSAGSIGEGERLVSVAAGAGLLIAGVVLLMRGRRLGGAWAAAAGGALTHRGISGRSLTYRAIGVEGDDATPTSHPLSRHVHVRQSILIDSDPQELYRRWRDLESLPAILKHVKRVTLLDERRSKWTVDGPAGVSVQWEAEITDEDPGSLLAWKSVGGGAVDTEGHVEFVPSRNGRGTLLRVNLVYKPAGGALGAMAAKLFGADPNVEIRSDLRRFKQIMETGVAISNEGPAGNDRTSPNHQLHAPTRGRSRNMPDRVEQASQESFPASDAPGW